MRGYTTIMDYDPEARAYAVLVPALPGCTSMGETVEEALANAQEAIAGHIATLEAIGETVPEEAPGSIVVASTATQHCGPMREEAAIVP